MAGFREKISLIIDADSKGGISGLKQFGTAVRGADGVVGKFKAGASSAMDSVKANAGTMALAGGAALVAFGVKALGAFTDVAMGARDLGAATGLAVEDASRWIAVADDMGLTAGDLTSGLGAITKTLDADKWEKYGIATRDAAGNARDANDILLDTFDVLSKETNLTERARLGKELLGKGYASLAPMIGKSRDEYEKMLGSVEKGQVITASEAKKAQKMAEAQDALGDALNEVTLALGGTVAGLAPLITLLADVVTFAEPAFEALGTLSQGINDIDWSDPMGGVDPLKQWATNAEIAALTIEEVEAAVKDSTLSIEAQNAYLAAWNKYNGEVVESTDTVTTSTEDMEAAANAAAQAAKDEVAALIELRDAAYEAASSMWDIEEATLAADGKYADYVALLADGKTTMAEARQAQIDQVQGYADIAAKTAEATGATATSREGVRLQIAALEDMRAKFPLLSADIDAYILKLKAIPTSVRTSVGITGPGSFAKVGNVAWEAEGAIHHSPMVVGVGDAPGGEAVLNKPQVRDVIEWAGMNGAASSSGGEPATSGASVVNNYYTTVTAPNVNPDDLIVAIRKFEKRNGPGWRA